MHYQTSRKQKDAATLYARQKVKEQHEKLKRVGMVCVECGKMKRYEDFPIHPRSGRVTIGKPCNDCVAFIASHYIKAPAPFKKPRKVREPKRKSCPGCREIRTEHAFHECGLCLLCVSEQRAISLKLEKICPVCNSKKPPLEFAGQKNCKACVSFLSVDTCEHCHKTFQSPEMLRGSTLCVYCAFERGREYDLIKLRAMMRLDRVTSARMVEFIKEKQEKSA